jgi:addiction module RelB/DinJ family antitoxin
MSTAIKLDTTVQFRADSAVKDGAFAVFREMGISPSTAMQLFLQQVQRTKTLPFIVTANHSEQDNEASYDEWLRERLDRTIVKLDSGTMKTYTSEEVRENLKTRRAEWRRS